VPESKGGPTHIDNLQTLCKDCNLGKGNRYHTDLRPGRGSARESDGGKRRGPRGTEAASPTSLEPLFPDDPPKI
jgi:5-methylcytosine-specific restriction endonuclease McrA